MFEDLSNRLQDAFSKARGYGKITEENISDILREIRIALLEADVNYKIVKDFTQKVKEKALGEEVKRSIKPGDMFVKIVSDELENLLGEKEEIKVTNKINYLMLVGLQGSGKTTTAGKIANFLRKKHNKKPLLVALDVYRPAAIEQLKQIGKELSITVYEEGNGDPLQIAKHALEYAKENDFNYLIFDTAGRLQINEELMNELKNLEDLIKPDELLLVIDIMTGQDAINVINGFNEKLKLTGTVLTKLDGDTRGGVALSARYLTNVPIKFIGTSEKMDGLDFFDPKRMASRILGMGDIVSLVEKAEEVIDKEEALRAAKKLEKGKFDLDDFLRQMKQVKKLGSLDKIIKLLPGARKLGLDQVKVDPKEILHLEAIVQSMTLEERRKPEIIKASRKERIARGSGRTVQEVNRLLNNFEQSQKMIKQMKSGNFKFPF